MVVGSPLGPLTLVASDGVLSGLYMVRQRYRPLEAEFGDVDSSPFGAVAEQLDEFFGGERTQFDVELALSGTEFQRRVWRELRRIPCGETVTYGGLARRLGDARLARAVGLANGRNPVGIIVPCHRLVGADGSLTGYGGGVERKRWLLDWEGRVAGRFLV
ncbi:MAG: methylated-DNA--[protein]-cysteine S-methyltransferase [Stackebrandtia sp.]